MKKFTVLLSTLLFLATSLAFGQRRGNVNYAVLANRAATPNFFFESIVLPQENESSAQLVFIFRMENSYLPFKKLSFDNEFNAPENAEFYSIARLNTEIFEGKASKKDLKNLTAVSRDSWQDTLFAKNYDETQSRKKFATGKLVTELNPGMYNFVLQLSLMEETDDQNSQRQSIKIENFNSKKTGEIYLIKEGSTASNLELVNLGNNVLYGKDYQALVRIPKYSSSEKYNLLISKARIDRKDTLNTEVVKTIPISESQIFNNSSLKILDNEQTALSINNDGGSFTYALVTVPNSSFENSIYNIELKTNSKTDPLAKKLVRSYWPDIPPSLLNLDISIEMLKYIVSEDQLKELKKGNSQEKEKKFRAFWEKRDPTPDTEFNELMTEYYNRVHYAFVEYRSPETPNGQDTDRGEVYIKYGPPNSRNRTFPKKGQVIETWSYGNRSFVFEKGAGFSEFMLVGK
ncbi:MAG: GWxTD domain-containing protein [Balneola sp.]